jgi:hypothetical protein
MNMSRGGKESDHMTERNEHDERGDRRVFEPAIARLREEFRRSQSAGC